ncbi:MAG: glycine cleavage system aminomethyltransferase GcvT, partial [Gammaproteobacteria bacterium]|nr:glycine cleavage system aminomethyltransferase GcvT [Gammaproteobacteria bacterium]
GNDMDESVTPLESYMANTVVLEGRDFIGADALRKQTEHDELVGLVMLGKGILRAHYPVFSNDAPVGEITSGAFSPTLGKSIALARVSATSSNMTVGIRGKMQAVECVNPPFVRNGKQVYKLRKT